jgi:hypothetical protein
MRPYIPAVLACLSASACAQPPSSSVPVNHLSATAEEAVAQRQEHAAGVLELQGEMADDTPTCGPVSLGKSNAECGPSTRENGETASDSLRAAQLREAAAQHRHVAMALENAQWRACEGLSDDEIGLSPFSRRADIVDVEVVTNAAQRVTGARVRFHEIGTLSADRLQRLVDCHLAMDNALGHDVPERAYSPLVPRGASATVTTVPHGYVIEVVSDDPDGAREIVRRAMALRPPGSR